MSNGSPVVPATRSLAAVLRRQLDEAGQGARLKVGTATAAPDALHVTVDFEGAARTIPRLAAFTPTVGKPVYCLVGETFMLALGDVGGVAGGGGTAGPPGPAGTPGEVWFTGAGAPAGTTGIVGDWYLDSVGGDYYEKTGTSAWTLRGNLRGPQGATGAQGAAGVGVPAGGSSGQVLTKTSGTDYATGWQTPAGGGGGGMTKLADVVLAAPGAFDVTSIPGTYLALRLLFWLRGTDASTLRLAFMRFNGDTGANYDTEQLRAVGNGAAGNEFLAQGQAKIGNLPGNTAPANSFGQATVDLMNYADATMNKVAVSAWTGKFSTASGGVDVGQLSNFWRSNAAINRIQAFPDIGSWAAGSRLIVYGLN